MTAKKEIENCVKARLAVAICAFLGRYEDAAFMVVYANDYDLYNDEEIKHLMACYPEFFKAVERIMRPHKR